MAISIESPDFGAIKARQRATWASGDYTVTGVDYVEELLERARFRADADGLPELVRFVRSGWGTEEGIEALFGDGVTSLQTRRERFVWHFTSAAQFIHLFRTYYGPTVKAFDVLEESDHAALTNELLETLERFAKLADGTLVVPAEYLEVVATRV